MTLPVMLRAAASLGGPRLVVSGSRRPAPAAQNRAARKIGIAGPGDSWDDGALVGDVDTGVWADINRIHAVNYTGRHYTTAGPMQVWRSPQGQPVLVQAGSSPQERDFAARVAEIVFSIQTRFRCPHERVSPRGAGV
jgi:alkanesulfonate monooxygenase SsuD/methylene tetrahydromethanopterin reductase-like flavin-dependent oxidoreductase (luciferase family)